MVIYLPSRHTPHVGADVWLDDTERICIMPPFVFLLLALLIFACAFGFMIYSDITRRAREKKRNQYHDRV